MSYEYREELENGLEALFEINKQRKSKTAAAEERNEEITEANNESFKKEEDKNDSSEN
ncbi:hypothetical protein RRU94_07870 [Domibacillus sp. DTU_2020_1001157_1_SI_ALB_TIR_016]|uniref:hypothetical protein n=1 Tax=Domibacillus sp. DTU_2020_1001157_1_SI_ALB_TIR_016 TaxID=3077789 RepID=UPI0028E2CD72|nr:hypothetical protein [Domibacillus sp. DTU_2020_1001157_1_SI_ALB_TIR_016]WNS78364.1 hypothetical protein RRU94_07870 [Domibacillus sp. DTU_2020_1001157_1_SI_ALB_TIR_016]